MHAWIALAGEALAALVSPPRCAACDAPVGLAVVFCGPCARAMVPWAGPKDAVRAGWEYGGPIARAITRMKYADRPDLARPLGHALARRAVPTRADAIVPVPLHPARLADRGFNQAALLARPLARLLHAPLAPWALERTRDTPRQAALDRADRLQNVANAFRASAKVAGRRLLVVDDVCTTGATLGACAEALRRSGAAEVAALVLARAR